MKKYRSLKIILIIFITTLSSCALSDVDKPCSISGKVTDSSGKGISDVIISYNTLTLKDSIKSSTDGTYKINLPGGSTVQLMFSKPGYTSKTSSLVILGNDKKVVDIKLNDLSEDAYFIVGVKEKEVLNTGETFSAGIYTNVSYEYESNTPWIACTKMGSELYIKCDSNETSEERFAKIILKAKYNHNDTIKIKQHAGPVLRVLDYIGKNSTSFPHTRPYVTFSREISVLSALGSNENLTVEISNDKKTVYFDNIKLNAFSSMPVQIKVKASDGIQLVFSLNLKLYINSQSMASQNVQDIYFTNDDKFVWVSTFIGSDRSLQQFSTADFSKSNQISGLKYNTMSYNPYNNSLYIIKQVYFEDRYISVIDIYDASTGLYKSNFTVDYNGYLVRDIEFSDTGYGIMIVGDNLFYIDSSNNHNFGIFSTSSVLYDPHQIGDMIPSQIEMCNNNKVFLLYGQDGSGIYHVYTIDSDTKVLKRIYYSNNFKFVTSNSGSYALYFTTYNDRIICHNVITNNKTTITLPSAGIDNLAILNSGQTLPDILTSDFSLISPTDNTTHNFSHQGYCYCLKSSNDGKLVLFNNNGTNYLFRSEIFTKFHDYIK